MASDKKDECEPACKSKQSKFAIGIMKNENDFVGNSSVADKLPVRDDSRVLPRLFQLRSHDH